MGYLFTSRFQSLSRVAGLFLLATILLVSGLPERGALAQSDRLIRANPATPPSVKPVRVERPPAIDGRLDDAAWRTAARVTEFVQRRPLDGAPASEPTEVYIAYDN